MDYICKNKDGYRLHIIKTNKFKTITLKLSFRRKIKRDEITIRNILGDVLLQSTKNYPSKRDLTIKSQDLYAASYSSSNIRIGYYFNTEFYMSVLNDKYTEEGNFLEALKFFKEIIFNPDVENNEFNKNSLEIVRTDARNYLKSIRDYPSRYSMIRMLEEYDKTSPVSYNMFGLLDSLEKITGKDLYEYYKDMLEKDIVDIYVLGDVEEDKIELLIKDIFRFNKLKIEKGEYIIPSKKAHPRMKEIIEEDNNSQSKLVIGARVENLTDYELKYVSTLFNTIFGGESDSKLFKIVREANSLCYSIHSSIIKCDNMLIIRSGIDKDNYDKCIKLIKKCLKEMQEGKFSEEDINIAKEYYITYLNGITDSEAKILDDYFIRDLIGLDSIEVSRKKILKVTKEEIVKVAKKVFLDTIFFLEGVQNEEN